jgi:hypothetical protein
VDTLTAWLDGLLTISGSETGSPWDDSPASDRDGEDLTPGEDAGWLDDLADDSDALDAWEYTFAEVLDITLAVADESDPVVVGDLDLAGHGPALVTRLFLSWRDGVRITELAGALKEAATADLAADAADSQWQEWVEAHGDPLRLLLRQLERLGAVSATDDVARLEPLGVRAVRSKLERDHLFVPLLPAPRGAPLLCQIAAREAGRSRSGRRGSARRTPTRASGRRMAMARLDHPDAEAVLTMIGRHASDKTTAKAARRAAYKASTRRAARR